MASAERLIGWHAHYKRADRKQRRGHADPYVRQAARLRRRERSIVLGLSLLEAVVFAACYGILKNAGY